MSFKDIQIALDTRLSTLPGSTPVAWENTEYKPTKGQEWIRPTLISASSTLSCLDVRGQMNPGIYRVDVFYPVDNGSGNLLEKLDTIREHFQESLSLRSNETIILIRAVSIFQKLIEEKSWFMGSVDVNFTNYDDLVEPILI